MGMIDVASIYVLSIPECTPYYTRSYCAFCMYRVAKYKWEYCWKNYVQDGFSWLFSCFHVPNFSKLEQTGDTWTSGTVEKLNSSIPVQQRLSSSKNNENCFNWTRERSFIFFGKELDGVLRVALILSILSNDTAFFTLSLPNMVQNLVLVLYFLGRKY
jgi:hypothetical protein